MYKYALREKITVRTEAGLEKGIVFGRCYKNGAIYDVEIPEKSPLHNVAEDRIASPFPTYVATGNGFAMAIPSGE